MSNSILVLGHSIWQNAVYITIFNDHLGSSTALWPRITGNTLVSLPLDSYSLFGFLTGLALIMEGVLSGCYHVCPNNSNFQFGKFSQPMTKVLQFSI